MFEIHRRENVSDDWEFWDFYEDQDMAVEDAKMLVLEGWQVKVMQIVWENTDA